MIMIEKSPLDAEHPGGIKFIAANLLQFFNGVGNYYTK